MSRCLCLNCRRQRHASSRHRRTKKPAPRRTRKTAKTDEAASVTQMDSDTTFIETQFPVSKLSKESYKERKANYSQTLTGLGKWWGRKPLIMVRAAILGLLLPASQDPKRDREIFLKLLTMDDEGLWRRKTKAIAARRGLSSGSDPPSASAGSTRTPPSRRFRPGTSAEDKARLQRLVFERMSYDEKLVYCDRPEQIEGPSESPGPRSTPTWAPTPAASRSWSRQLGRASLRSHPAGGRRLLRRRQRPLRGGAHRLRRLRLGPEPSRRPADLGGAQHRRRRRGGGQAGPRGPGAGLRRRGPADHRLGHRAQRGGRPGRCLSLLHRDPVPRVRLDGAPGPLLGHRREDHDPRQARSPTRPERRFDIEIHQGVSTRRRWPPRRPARCASSRLDAPTAASPRP